MDIVKLNNNVQIAELADLGLSHAKTFDECDERVKADEVLSLIIAEEKAEADALIAVTNKNKVQINLSSLDEARDSAISAARDLAFAFRALKDAEKKAAAEKISAIFGKYKGITRLSLANESGQIASLVLDLESEEVGEAAKKLDGMEDAIGDIKVAEAAFQAARHKSDGDISVSKETASDVKKRLLCVINSKLVPYLSVVSVVKADVFSTFTSQIAVSISRLNATVSQRLKKREK